MKERELIVFIESDTDKGFRILLQQYRDRVYWHIRRITVNHEDAQDAAQETFIRIYRSLERLKGVRNI